MATLPLSTPCRGTQTSSRCHSISGIINLSSRNGVHKLFLSSIRPSGSRRVRRLLSIKSVLGERKEKLEEIVEEGKSFILLVQCSDHRYCFDFCFVSVFLFVSCRLISDWWFWIQWRCFSMLCFDVGMEYEWYGMNFLLQMDCVVNACLYSNSIIVHLRVIFC